VTSLKPLAPFIWPEPRIRERITTYEGKPPFAEIALSATSLFGVTPALTIRGVDVLEEWLKANPDLKASVIIIVYPICATRQSDLDHLHAVVKRHADRLAAQVWPLEQVTDRSINALCFSTKNSDTVHIVVGPSEGLGLDPWGDGHLNFAFRADPSLVEAFRRHFDWLWTLSCEINSLRATAIPDLLLPQGSEEGARMWQAYMNELLSAAANTDVPRLVAHVVPETGEVTIKSADGVVQQSPTERLGIKKLDLLADRVARLYDRGTLVSIDKLSRIPPLDAPLDPGLFGDASELHQGNVTRKVSMRVSVLDENTLKEIDTRRQGLRTLLTKFTFGVADNIRWMPATARELFESELRKLNEQGKKLISDLLRGDVDAFLKGKHNGLVRDLNAMYSQLGGRGQVTEDVIAKVVENLKNRLTMAQKNNFMPKLSYSSISFAYTDNEFASPWQQAYSLLSDIATFPRNALTDNFFFRGLKTPEEELIKAMNVADDALLHDSGTFKLKDRCKTELDLLSKIEKASVEPKMRCDLVWKTIDGAPVRSIEEELVKNRHEEEAN
jgi:hypothetical protein